MPQATVTGRLIYPDAAVSRSLARCSVGAQLLFDRLITTSDDQGRQRDGRDVVKVSAFPLMKRVRESDVERWLSELEANDLILRYEAEGESLIQLPGWWRWQRLEWARPSRYASPDGWTDREGKRPKEPLRTSPDSSGTVRQNQKENQKENQNGPVRTRPDTTNGQEERKKTDPRSLREIIGPPESMISAAGTKR